MPEIIRHRFAAPLAAGMLGAVAVVGFAPLDFYLLPPLALALWWLLLRGATPRRAAGLGFAWGLGLFGVGVSWIFNSLLIFGQAPWLVASLITVLFVLYLALYPALLAWAAARWLQAAPLGYWLGALAAGWVLLEALRGAFLTGFPWLLFGHTLLDSPARDWLPLAGEYGASLVVALTAVALALLLLRRWWAGAALATLLVLSSLGALLPRWVEPVGEPLSVALVQGNIEQARKWEPDGLEFSMAHYQQLSRAVAGVDVLVWPETAIPGFYFEVYAELERYAELMLQQGTELVTGIFDYDPRDGAIYNSIRHLPSGVTYDKRQLVPFGEFIPFRDRLDWLHQLLAIPMSDLTPGEGDGRVNVAGHTAGFSVCYEAAYARRLRPALPAAGLLLNVSNDAWFGRSLAPYQHLQIARVRALELGRPLVRATNTGISALIDADGRIIAQTALFTEAVLQGQIQPRQGLTPAARHGSWPALALALVLVALALWSGRPSRRER